MWSCITNTIPEQFRRPETRLARHILITINDTIAENTRSAAGKRINAIQARLAKEPQRFEEQALKHSECPTALDGGKLGDLPRGKLFPELDKALFELKAGEVSGVLESELGFHVLRCDTITEAGVLGLRRCQTTHPQTHGTETQTRVPTGVGQSIAGKITRPMQAGLLSDHDGHPNLRLQRYILRKCLSLRQRQLAI